MKSLLLKIIFFITFITIVNFGFNQTIVRKFVLDDEIKIPIPFVNIQLKSGTKGWVSNENGAFEVNLDLLKESDIFILSAIGYQNLMLSYNQFNDTGIVTMLPKTFTLNEVEVKARKYKKGYLGQRRRASVNKFNTGFSKRELNSSYKEAIYIPNTLGAEGIIDNIHLFVNKGSKTPIEIDILSHDIIKGTPKNSLLTKPILVKEEEDRKWMNISIKNENISIPQNGFYISVNWNVEAIYIEKEDTLIREATMNGKNIADTIFSNGMIIGSTYYTNRYLWRVNLKGKWVNSYDEQFNIYSPINPEKHNDSIKYNYATLAIYASILYDKANKHHQENIFDKNGLVPDKLVAKILKKKHKKTKQNTVLYPQNDILSLFKSIKKTQNEKQVAYLLQHLYFYTYEELEDLINREITEQNITLPFIDDLINNPDKINLTEIEQGLYSFEYENTLYGNLQLNKGEWKLSPTFNVISDNK